MRTSLLTGDALVTLVPTGGDSAAERALVDLVGSAAPHIVGFVINVHEAPGNAPLDARFVALAGTPFLTERSGLLETTPNSTTRPS